MLATLNKLKPLLYLPLEDDSQDESLRLCLQAASSAIEDHCQRSFGYGEYKTVRSGSSLSYVALPNYPIEQATILHEDREITDFVLVNDGILYRSSGWPRGEHNLSVTYTGGYILPSDAPDAPPSTLPHAVELAALTLAKLIFTGEWGKEEERFGQSYAVKYVTNGLSLPPMVAALVHSYVWRLG